MMKHVLTLSLLFSLLILASLNGGCKKKKMISNGNLRFSIDTLVFDTVFTTIGSTTKQFKIYNDDNKTLTIQEVQLMGGENSPFRMNLDGLQGISFSDLKLEGGDSLFCFVEVTLETNGQLLPAVIEDSIRFRTNGIDQYIRLAVWGQDMYYHYSNFQTNLFDLNEGTWPNDKPHLIYGAAFVDSAKTLEIQAGTQVYLHKNSILYNYKGTLNINGTLNNKVTFQGDRLEAFYADVPGQYYGIYFQEARPSTITNVVIKNATAGIHVFSRDNSFSQSTVTINNSEILNSASYGLFLFDGPKVSATNLLVHSSGVHALLVLQGAEFDFLHCDFLSYGTGDATTPAVGIRNYYTANGTTTVGQIPNGTFNNCVIYGGGSEELVFDTLQPGGVLLNFDFNNCLIRKTSSTNTIYTSCLFNVDPVFNGPYGDNFRFNSPSSGLNNNGNSNFLPSTDFFGLSRNNPPDIGVYESF